MGSNFIFGIFLGKEFKRKAKTQGRIFLTFGITLNLLLLMYFKYAGFFVENINLITSSSIDLGHILLPLGISFFTFQQIAYLVDAYKGITQEYKLSHYSLFVVYFPQLIAGPIVHHADMLPQFMRPNAFRPQLKNLNVGLCIFSIGLFKKTVLADGVANYATPVFNMASGGEAVTFFEAWGGALAYTLQLYFDFSGYSDMAIGAARLFGIDLPLNFYSPYKATNIIEFWRRWHMTLSRFFRDYVYIPLGGNQSGVLWGSGNLMVTMLLGGLWHGAGWTFIFWGGLHGVYLIVNHGWKKAYLSLLPSGFLPKPISRILSWFVTFIAVVVAWVFFRATSFDSALIIIQGMVGGSGISLPNAVAVRLGEYVELLEIVGIDTYIGGGAQFIFTYLWISCLLPLVLFFPNTYQIMKKISTKPGPS